MAAYTSVTGGDWNNPATWGGGGYPSADGDTVTIAAGHEVIYNVYAPTVELGYMSISGTLRWSRTMSTYMKYGYGNCASIALQNGGLLYIGNSDAEPIPAQYTATIEFTFTSTDRGINVSATTGTWKLYGDPNYLPLAKRTGRLASTWSSGQTFTLVGDYTSWRVGDKILVNRYRQPVDTNPAVNDNYILTVASAVLNGSNTDITVVESFWATCYERGYVVNMNPCNVSFFHTNAIPTSAQRLFLIVKSNATVSPNCVAKNIMLYSGEIAIAYYGEISDCFLRNGNYGIYSTYATAINNCIFAITSQAIYATRGCTINNCIFARAGIGGYNYSVHFVDCIQYGANSHCFGLGGTPEMVFDRCYVFGCAGYITIYPNVILRDCYYYNNYAGYYGGVEGKFLRFHYGIDDLGNIKPATVYADMYIDMPQTILSKDSIWKFGSTGLYLLPVNDGRRNSIAIRKSELYSQNHNQVEGVHKRWAQYANIENSTTTHNLASQSLKCTPSSNCGSSVVPAGEQAAAVIVEDWIEHNVPASVQNRRVYIKGEAWSSFPTNTELYLEAEYYNAAGTWTTTTAVSTEVLTDNTTWTALTLSFIPARVGPVTYRVVLAKYESGASVYLDHALYYTPTQFVEATFDWGKSVLPAISGQAIRGINKVRFGAAKV